MNQSRGDAAEQRRARERELFAQYAALRDVPGHEEEVAVLRDELIVMHTGLVKHLARLQPSEDLVQAGMVGLITAVDRFDPDRGAAFSTFAVPHIRGAMRECRERDEWQVQVPRRLRHLHGQVRATRARMRAEGTHPTVQDLAAELDVHVEDILEAMALDEVQHPVWLDAPVADDESSTRGDQIGSADPALDRVEQMETMRTLLDALNEDERVAITAKFFEQRTQEEIATTMGLPPSRVSRLVSRGLAKMRAQSGQLT